MVVWPIVYFHPYLGKVSNLTNIFQMGWNHQLAQRCFRFLTPWQGVRQEPLPRQLPQSPVDVPPAKRAETVLAPVTEPTTVPSTQLEPVTAMVETVKDPMSPEALRGLELEELVIWGVWEDKT